MMHCIEHGAGGDAAVLTLATAPRPEPKAGKVRIRVAYAGVNRPDVLQRSGRYPPPQDASPILGLEVAGVIDAVGPDVTRWTPGDRVAALTPGGGYAEFCVAPADHCLPVPDGFSLLTAAALPENLFTVWANVFMTARLAAGESFLVHGGASGIGYTATQLARLMGARVYTTVGSAAKAEFAMQHGAHAAFDYSQGDWLAWILEATQSRGVDVILDMVGGDYVMKNFKALAIEGRLMQIAFLRGPKVEIDATAIMLKRLNWGGSTLRARSRAAKAAICAAVEEQVWPHVLSGAFKVAIHSTFPLGDARTAHELMESNQHVGKIMLAVADID
jgi:NADPH:quinone reductase